MKKLTVIFLLFICNVPILLSQSINAAKQLTTDTITQKVFKPEIFNSGFIDIINNGQVNASARLIRLFIGEQGKFAIPLSFYGGVSGNNFQNQNAGGSILTKSNDHLVNQYINPLSGLINISIEDIKYFKKYTRVTKSGLLYQVGERVLNGVRIGEISNPLTGKPTNFLNGFATLGLYFQTGAWEKTNAKNVGIFWLATRYHFCYTNPTQIKQFLPDIETNGIYTGYSLGFGIEINNLVNIKAIYYKYTKAPEIDYGLPIYQFSFNYTMNKN
jgi:hypothetical protein